MEMYKKKQAINSTNEACSNMIAEVRQLRLLVLDLFTTLADSGPDPSRMAQLREQTPQPYNHPFVNNHHSAPKDTNHASRLYYQQKVSNLATSHTLCTSSLPPSTIQKQQEQQRHEDLLHYVNHMISSISGTIRALDQDIMVLMQNNGIINPGESIHLGMDCSLDKHNLYVDMCQSYSDLSKLFEYSTHCHQLLHQQSLKRAHKRSSEPPPTSATSGGGSRGGDQRHEHVVATFNPYSYKIISNSSASAALESYLKACEYMHGIYSQPFGSSTGILQISVNRIFKAILVMRGILIDYVIVKAHHESFSSKANSKQNPFRSSGALLNSPPATSSSSSSSSSYFVDTENDDIDLWSDSKYAVFRKLSNHANAAVLHFQYPQFQEIAVRSFLVSIDTLCSCSPDGDHRSFSWARATGALQRAASTSERESLSCRNCCRYVALLRTCGNRLIRRRKSSTIYTFFAMHVSRLVRSNLQMINTLLFDLFRQSHGSIHTRTCSRQLARDVIRDYASSCRPYVEISRQVSIHITIVANKRKRTHKKMIDAHTYIHVFR